MSEPRAWTVQMFEDEQGRPFSFVHVPHREGAPLVIHFSAFFGKWGDARAYRDRFQGYFHRLRMLTSDETKNWLFLCDAYGAFKNGTYYTGSRGDLFVERAMLEIIDRVSSEHGYATNEMVTVGSSMGGTAAVKFALVRRMRGCVAIGPHIDLDISAERQGRMAEVAWIVPDADPLAVHNQPITRQIRALVASYDGHLPALFVQSCEDDAGVHYEQVVPLVEQWRERGGRVYLDARAVGGHTSDFATRSLLLDAIGRIQRQESIDVLRYQRDPSFAGRLTPRPISHRVRRRLSLIRRRVRDIVRSWSTGHDAGPRSNRPKA